jgi:hypothetical protein
MFEDTTNRFEARRSLHVRRDWLVRLRSLPRSGDDFRRIEQGAPLIDELEGLGLVRVIVLDGSFRARRTEAGDSIVRREVWTK